MTIAKCCMCAAKMEIMMRNPWGDLHLLCRAGQPDFIKKFWPNKD